MINLPKLLKSFTFAFKGFDTLIKQENNFRFHLLAAMVVIFLSIYLEITKVEWILIILCIALVWMAEAFNSALEMLVDLVTAEKNPLAGKIKDVAAAAVTLMAMGALIVGIIVFYPHLVG